MPDTVNGESAMERLEREALGGADTNDPDFAEIEGIGEQAPDPLLADEPTLPAAWFEILANGDISHIALDTLRGDLRRGMLDRLRAMPKPWTVMSEFEQNMLIQSMDTFATHVLGQALLLLANADAYVRLDGLLIKTETKGATIKTQVDFARQMDDASRIALEHAVGQRVMVLLIDRDSFMGEREPDQPDPDEPKLPMEPDTSGGSVTKLRGRRKKDDL